jgi:lactoylglutathione lyase
MPGRPGKVTTRADGVRQCFVRDPDGHFIEINDARPRG